MADNDVSVTFGADVSNLNAGAQQASAAVKAMADTTRASASQAQAAFGQFQTAATASFGANAQVASAANQASAALASNAGAANTAAAAHAKVASSAHGAGAGIGFYIREAHALSDELLSGRFTQAQGTFSNLFVTFAQANPTLAAFGAAAAVVAGTIGYLAYQAGATQRAIGDIQLTATVQQFQLTDQAAKDLLASVKETADVSSGDAAKIAQSFMRIGGEAGPALAQISSVYLPMLAREMGGDATQAAEKLSSMFADLTGAGRQYLAATNGVSAGTIETYDRFVQAGQAGQAYQLIVDAMIHRLEGAREATVEKNAATNAETALAMAAGDAEYSLADKERFLALETSGTTAKLNEQIASLRTLRSELAGATSAQQQYAAALATANRFDAVRAQIDQTRNSIKLMSDQLAVATKSGDSAGVEALSRGIDRASDSLKKLQQQSADGLLGRDAVQQVHERLTELDNTWKGSTVDRVQAEKAALTQILSDTSLTAAQRHDVEVEIAAKDKELRDAGFRDFQAHENLKVAVANQNKSAVLAVRQDELKQAVATYGQDSDQAIAAMQQVQAARNAIANEAQKAAKSTASFDSQTSNNEKLAALADLDTKVGAIKEAASEREIDFETERRQLLEIAAQRRAVELQYVNDKSSSASQRLRIDAEYAKATEKVTADVNKQIYDDYRRTYEQVGTAVSGQIDGMIRGQTTFGQAAENVALSIVEQWIAARIKMVADWAAGQAMQVAATQAAETAKTAAVAGGVAARTAAESTGSAASLVTTAATVTKSIAASAAETFAGIFGFLSPVMGPAAAGPAASGEATVAAVAGSVPSFAVGAWSLPSDMLAQVHQGEMIVPAAPAAAMRAAMSSTAQSPSVTMQHTTHINVSAVDGASVASFFQNNSKPLLRAINDAVRKGTHLGLSKLATT